MVYYVSTHEACLTDCLALPKPILMAFLQRSPQNQQVWLNTVLNDYGRHIEVLDSLSMKEYPGITETRRKNRFESFITEGCLFVPQEQARRIGLRGEVVLVGAFDHFEIWDTNKYRRITQETEPDYEEAFGL